MSTKNDNQWIKIQDFANENKGNLIMVANPKTDEILVSFNGFSTFVKFPFESMEKGVVFNCLRKSKFNDAIDAFMTGLIDSTGIEMEGNADGQQLYHVLGGSMKALGVEAKRSAPIQIINNEKKNGSKKTKRSSK